MENSKPVKYPENLPLKLEVFKSGRTITDLAGILGVNRVILSLTVNGHYKGSNIVPRLKEELAKEELAK